MVTDESYQQYCDTQKAWEAQQDQRHEQAREQASSGLTEEQQKIIDEGNAYIRRIRQCNDDLPGECDLREAVPPGACDHKDF